MNTAQLSPVNGPIHTITPPAGPRRKRRRRKDRKAATIDLPSIPEEPRDGSPPPDSPGNRAVDEDILDEDILLPRTSTHHPGVVITQEGLCDGLLLTSTPSYNTMEGDSPATTILPSPPIGTVDTTFIVTIPDHFIPRTMPARFRVPNHTSRVEDTLSRKRHHGRQWQHHLGPVPLEPKKQLPPDYSIPPHSRRPTRRTITLDPPTETSADRPTAPIFPLSPVPLILPHKSKLITFRKTRPCLNLSFEKSKFSYDVYDKITSNFISSNTLQIMSLNGVRLLVYRLSRPYYLVPLHHFNPIDTWFIDLRVNHPGFPRPILTPFQIHTSQSSFIILSLCNHKAFSTHLAAVSVNFTPSPPPTRHSFFSDHNGRAVASPSESLTDLTAGDQPSFSTN